MKTYAINCAMGIGFYCHMSQNLVITCHAMSSSWEIELLLVAKVIGILYTNSTPQICIHTNRKIKGHFIPKMTSYIDYNHKTTMPHGMLMSFATT
jgi:hypothetical protein